MANRLAPLFGGQGFFVFLPPFVRRGGLPPGSAGASLLWDVFKTEEGSKQAPALSQQDYIFPAQHYKLSAQLQSAIIWGRERQRRSAWWNYT